MIYRVTVKRQNEILLKYNIPYFYSIFVITKFKNGSLGRSFFFIISIVIMDNSKPSKLYDHEKTPILKINPRNSKFKKYYSYSMFQL